jgi:large subunit ribosomal protein L6
MSRIGKMPIALPAGVKITVSDDNLVTVEGKLGKLTQQVAAVTTVKVEGNEILVGRIDDTQEAKAWTLPHPYCQYGKRCI